MSKDSNLKQPQPFNLDVSRDAIDGLHSKLSMAHFPDELTEVGWDYGVPLKEVKRLVNIWLNEYDWKAHEKIMNETTPQFTLDLDIDGHGILKVHFVHAKSTRKGAVPLLFLHGWPGSFHEVSKILQPLTTPTDEAHPAFHIVAISLPGFGFSDAPTKKGFATTQYAESGHKLMLALGYPEYVVQGGDVGSRIGALIADIYGTKHCKALHRNVSPFLQPPKFTQNPWLWLKSLIIQLTPEDLASRERWGRFLKEGQGYAAIHSTQPQTIGYALADSPVGLLAWIYEKIHNWSDGCPFTDEEILTWISIYYFSKSGPAASLRIYYERAKEKPPTATSKPINLEVPLGLSIFPKELMFGPRPWRQATGHLVYERSHDKGGHFAALERPEDLVADLREMFGQGGVAFGVVPSKNGY